MTKGTWSFFAALSGAPIAVVAAYDGNSWIALGIGFVTGANLVFGLSDLRDYYRVKCGRLRVGNA